MNRGRMLWEITRWELLRWLKIKDVIRTVVISSVLGLAIWGGLALIEKYTRDADQETMAGAAIIAWENASGTKNGKAR